MTDDDPIMTGIARHHEISDELDLLDDDGLGEPMTATGGFLSESADRWVASRSARGRALEISF